MVRPWPTGPQPGALEVRVPGSSANIGPGFDSIGLALGIWDAYLVELTDAPGLEVVLEGEGDGDIPLDEGHLVHRSMLRAWAALGVHPPGGIRLVCRNTVPQGRGLGSSAAAIVAGVVAAQGLYDAARHGPDHDVADFDRSFTNDLASAVEGHPDNASASVYGGMTLSWADDAVPGRVHSVQLDVHPDVVPVVLVPATTLPTSTARAVLPERIAHAQAALNVRAQRPPRGGRQPPPRPPAAGHPGVAAPGAAPCVVPRHHGARGCAAGARPRSRGVRRGAERPGARDHGHRRLGAGARRRARLARGRAGNAFHRRRRSTCYIE